jgi:hypothetical protein
MSQVIQEPCTRTDTSAILIALSTVTCAVVLPSEAPAAGDKQNQHHAIPLRDPAARKFHAAANRGRSDSAGSVAGLEAELSISESQMKAWAGFAETLSANARRLDSVDGGRDHPFGCLPARLMALHSMRRAAAVLFSVLDPAQQRRAMQLLPLCCLPTTRAG